MKKMKCKLTTTVPKKYKMAWHHLTSFGLQDVYPIFDNDDDNELPTLTTSMKRRQRRVWQKLQQKKRLSLVICTLYRTIDQPISSSCPITCEEFTGNDNVIIIKQCRHVFKAKALKTWLQTHSTCPMCRCYCVI